MQLLQLSFVVKVHAASGCWEQAHEVLQPAIAEAQDAVESDIEEEDSEFTGALEAVTFQLFALQLQAAWHLQHSHSSSETYTLCVQTAAQASSIEEKASYVQHLVMAHLKFVAHELYEHCSAQQLQQVWRLLQQANSLIDNETTSHTCSKKWIGTAKSDVRPHFHPLLSTPLGASVHVRARVLVRLVWLNLTTPAT
jgi:hypothetical protein